MRSVPSDIASRLAMKKQTLANAADLYASIWIGRPTTPLTTETFLERQTVLTGTSVTDTSIAVCHPRKGGVNTKISIAYIDGGVCKVVTALSKTKMSSHVWVDEGFEEDATAVSIAYDGTMPKDNTSLVEFVTEAYPWVFWADNSGALYGTKLEDYDPVTLAVANCTDVSAIRAMWSSVGGFDFGLVVFFILSGSLYYRQLINGEWMDAELVSFGPSGVTWTEVAAFRTWDYRVGVQLKDSTGDIYELFTQFMGIGKQNVDHISLTGVEATGEMTKVSYYDAKNQDEHIEVASVEPTAPYGGLYSISLPTLVSAHNENDGNGDWGKKAIFVFNSEVNGVEAAAQFSCFKITDSRGTAFSPSSVTVGSDGKIVTLIFADFNNARGECAASYTPGTVTSMYGDTMTATSVAFTPTNLVPTELPLPEVEMIWNE